MIFELGQCAEQNRRKIRGFKKVGKVIAGVRFVDGIEQNEATDRSKQSA